MTQAPVGESRTARSSPAGGRHHVELVMGMAVSIDIRDEIAAGAVDDVLRWLHHVDATFSTYDPGTPISRLGVGAASFADMSDEVIGVLELCDALHVDTEGAFDAYAVPAPNGSHLDPSGVVKGWAVERAAVILEDHGARNFCINAGGDIVLRGGARPGEEWRVGIRHPDSPDMSAAVVTGSGRLAVATSATYERGAHIIDPSTGQATADVASVTIIGPDLTYADAYATAVFVMGIDGLDWLIRRHPDYAGLVITHQDTVVSTPNFAEHRAS
jgi:thiamine biosynthesis lipoprotein